MRLARQPPRFDARFLQAEDRRISCLLRGGIFSGALSELLARLRDIKNVVDHLEREPERATEIADRGSWVAGVGAHRAEAHGSGEKRRGFVFVNVTELRAS